VEAEVVADVDDVPRDLTGLDLRLDRRVRRVLILGELDTGQGRVGLQPRLALSLLVDATEGREAERDPVLLRRIAGCRCRSACALRCGGRFAGGRLTQPGLPRPRRQ